MIEKLIERVGAEYERQLSEAGITIDAPEIIGGDAPLWWNVIQEISPQHDSQDDLEQRSVAPMSAALVEAAKRRGCTHARHLLWSFGERDGKLYACIIARGFSNGVDHAVE